MSEIEKISCPYCNASIDIDSKYCKDCGSSIGIDASPETPTIGINIGQKRDLEEDMIFGDRFKILAKVGEGGFGSVYKAEDKRLNEIVCLKVLDVKLTLDLAHKDRFVREIKLARKITHPNVVRMFDFAEVGDTYVVTMEFVDGCTLQERLKRGNLTINDMISYVEQVCRALDAAHVMGIIHRDIKPGNILIDKDDNVKIVDFGLAKVGDITGVTDSGAIMGTPEYMSPEQVLSQPIDNRVDFYSLGLVMYEMFTGVLPFKCDTPMATALKRTVEDPVPPKTINPTLMNWLNRIIMKMIQRDKKKRYSSGSEIIYDLAKGRGESSIVEEYLKRVEFYIEEKDYEKSKTVLQKVMTLDSSNLKALELQQKLETLLTTIEITKNDAPPKSKFDIITAVFTSIKFLVTEKFETKHWIVLASFTGALCFILFLFFLFSGTIQDEVSFEEYIQKAQNYRERQRYEDSITNYKLAFRINPTFTLFLKLIIVYIEKLGKEHSSLPYIIIFLVFVIITCMFYLIYKRR